jgi:hypothetical protein
MERRLGLEERESGIQITPDAKRTLINKDVGDERWAITRNADDGSVTGNVFFPDGRDPLFLFCALTQQQGSELSFDCFGADSCTASPCGGDQFSFIAAVTLPESFFLPPASNTCQDTFGDACNPELGADACCIPDLPGIPCQTNDTSPVEPICTDVVGEPTCQPQLGAPCDRGGYVGCCSDELACVNGVCSEQ